MSHLTALSNDQSWRIKHYFCDKLADINKAIGKAEFKKTFVRTYLAYLDDQEPEVSARVCQRDFILTCLQLRAIASSKLDIAGGSMEKEEIVRDLVPLVKKLSQDSQNYVRTSLSTSFLGLS